MVIIWGDRPILISLVSEPEPDIAPVHRTAHRASVYLATVAVIGAVTIARSMVAVAQSSLGYDWLLLAGLTAAHGTFSIRSPFKCANLRLGSVCLHSGAPVRDQTFATLVVALDSLILTSWLRSPTPRRTPPVQRDCGRAGNISSMQVSGSGRYRSIQVPTVPLESSCFSRSSGSRSRPPNQQLARRLCSWA